MKEYGYIYKTTNIKNGRIYIGQKKGMFKSNYYGSGILIKNAIKKNGLDNFKLEVLRYAISKEELDDLEKMYIKSYRNEYNVYNISEGANINPLSKESRHKISIKLKGRVFSESWRRNLSIAGKKKKLSEEHKRKIAEASKGRSPWNTGLKLGSNPELSKRLIGNTYAVGYRHTKEFINRLSHRIKELHTQGVYKGKIPFGWNKGIKGSTRKNNLIKETVES